MKDEYREYEQQGYRVRSLGDGRVAIFNPETGWWINTGDGASTGCSPALYHLATEEEKRARIAECWQEFLEEPDLRKRWERPDPERAVRREAELSWFQKAMRKFYWSITNDR